MKLLLYCTKNKWRLFFDSVKQVFTLGKIKSNNDLNGKIVAECDYEVEEIKLLEDCNATMITNTLSEEELLKKSCLEGYELCNYLYDNLWCGQKGYAIHIKNLHIFDKPRELSDYYSRAKKMNTFDWYRSKGYEWVCESIDKAPQNMMYCCDEKEKDYILISIRPEYLVDILNGEKTIEVRKKVLKEMVK